MTELRASLLKWEQLEPARVWRDVHGLLVVQVGKRSTSHLTQPGLLLAAVIEAIEAREGIWDYRLAWRMAPTGEHFGVVRVTREDGWEKSWSCYAETPAAALLGAYLAALEAEAGQ